MKICEKCILSLIRIILINQWCPAGSFSILPPRLASFIGAHAVQACRALAAGARRGSSGVQAAASPQHPSRCCSGDRSCTFLCSNLLFVHNCTHTFSSLLTLPNSPHPQQMPPASTELLLLCFLTHGSGPKPIFSPFPPVSVRTAACLLHPFTALSSGSPPGLLSQNISLSTVPLTPVVVFSPMCFYFPLVYNYA